LAESSQKEEEEEEEEVERRRKRGEEALRDRGKRVRARREHRGMKSSSDVERM